LIREYGLVRDAGMQGRLDRVARTLARHVPGGDRYRFGILGSNDVNAMTTPDGQVFVTHRLLRVFGDDAELAAVLAHEIAHVLLGHTARLLTEPDEERIIIARTRRGRPVRRIITTTSNAKKQWEYAADEMGLGLLEKAGYPGEAAERVLEYLASQERGRTRRNGVGSRLDALTSTHPRSMDRLRAVRAILARRTAATTRPAYPPTRSRR
jgi:predicted Zn-dependent protease